MANKQSVIMLFSFSSQIIIVVTHGSALHVEMARKLKTAAPINVLAVIKLA